MVPYSKEMHARFWRRAIAVKERGPSRCGSDAANLGSVASSRSVANWARRLRY